MTDPDKNRSTGGDETPSWSASDPMNPSGPEYDSTSDYEATASASLSDTPVAPEPGAVFGAPGTGPGWDTYSGMGNGPGWSDQPTYPPPAGTPAPQAYGGQHYNTPQGAYNYQGQFGQPDPAAPYGRHPVTGEPLSDKSKVAAGLLQILLGFVGICGVGRLYIGSTAIGLTQMLVVFLGYILMVVLIGFIIVPVVWLWALIDGIRMLTGGIPDAQGRPLRD